MKVAIDARGMLAPRPRGGGKCMIDLYHHLAKVRPTWRFVALHDQASLMHWRESVFGELLPRDRFAFHRVSGAGVGSHAWERVRLPLSAQSHHADVLHCPASVCPPRSHMPVLVTVHDTAALDLPTHGDVERVQSLRHACEQASHVVAPSQYVRNRLIDRFDADASRIGVVPFAADPRIEVGRDIRADAFKRLGIRRRFVLHFASDPARHNTQRMIEAWSLVDRKLRSKHHLVVIGLDEQAKDRYRGVMQRLGLKRSVLLHGFVDEHDVPTLMHAARALAYPSLSEGFGQPILDAWAAETPVLTSDAAAMRELGEGGVVTVDPQDPCAIARRLTPMLHERTLRRTLRARGRERLAQFTWEQTAERFAQATEGIASQRRLEAA